MPSPPQRLVRYIRHRRVQRSRPDERKLTEQLVDFAPAWRETIARVQPYTLTTPERIGALIAAVEHVVRHDIAGAIVECGVWKGGSSMAAALTLRRLGVTRDLCLFDTFEGMPEPSSADVDFRGRPVHWEPRAGAVSLDEARRAMTLTEYPPERVNFVKGRVEDTLPAQAPPGISVLRLDTDWYESTLHELATLYPRLASGGILIVDDYGFFRGAKRAVDEYFRDQPIFLNRVDFSARLVVKP